MMPERSEPDWQSSSDAADPKKEQPLCVVGIGASAGGIPALRSFFQGVPRDSRLVFIVVMHLSPDYDSNLAEVLQTTVELPVRKVVRRMRMEPNHVYVIPQNRSLAVTDGYLEVAEFSGSAERRAAIDFLFRSIAEADQDAVGVLLSGSGSDGSLGMRAIKARGGVILAQEPEEAEHGEMPRAIIATGAVDFVLPAHELGAKVVELGARGRPRRFEAVPELPPTDAELLHRIMLLLRARTGSDFTGYKRSTVLRRIARRMRVTQAEGLAEYAEFLHEMPQEAAALLQDLLISVTRFFRDPEVFALLARDIVPKLFRNRTSDDTVRVWVAGCATGEEAYTVAMLLHEYAAKLSAPPAVQIFASDLDDDAIAFARAGVYPAAIAADIDEARLHRYFQPEGAFYRVREELRELILFATHDLLSDPPFSRVHLITCRNLLIYLERAYQERVFELFQYALHGQGFLMLGTSESVAADSPFFRDVDRASRIYQRKPTSGRVTAGMLDVPLTRSAAARGAPPRTRPTDMRRSTDAELHHSMLEQHAPPSILVDGDHTILHVSGTATRFLQFPSGSPHANLLKVARPELRSALGAALYQALQKRRPTNTRPTLLTIEGEPRTVQMHVAPGAGAGDPLALVVFLEGTAADTEPATASWAPSGGPTHKDEEELGALQQRLQQTVEEAETREEELTAANEELQSINEEYRSTLDELETGREELQSMNEEMTAVNDELQMKLEELARSNDDLRNLMSATDIATLFLDRRLCINRFTPAARRIFNIMPGDEGRPLADLTHRLDYDALGQDCVHVLDTLKPLEREVDTTDGASFLARMTPYRTNDDRIAGVVVTFTDISGVRDAQEQLRRSEEQHRLLIECVKEYAIFTMDADGRITMWNPGAERIFGYREEEALGQPASLIFTPEDRAAGAPAQEMQVAFSRGDVLEERWHVRRDGSVFWASGTLTALFDGSGSLHGYAKVLRDNTARQEQETAARESEARMRSLNETLESRVAERTSDLAEANDRVRQLASELVLAEQRARRDIARRLHDDLQQQLFGVQLKLATLRRQAAAPVSPQVAAQFDELERWLTDAVVMARQLTADISPPVLGSDDLADAFSWLAHQMRDVHDLRVLVRDHGLGPVADQDVRILVFQSVRELLFNVVKHADVPQAIVELRRDDDRIMVEVQDDGPGFDAAEVLARTSGEGFGLINVLERLRLFSGDLDIESAPGSATRVTVIAPDRSRRQSGTAPDNPGAGTADD